MYNEDYEQYNIKHKIYIGCQAFLGGAGLLEITYVEDIWKGIVLSTIIGLGIGYLQWEVWKMKKALISDNYTVE